MNRNELAQKVPYFYIKYWVLRLSLSGGGGGVRLVGGHLHLRPSSGRDHTVVVNIVEFILNTRLSLPQKCCVVAFPRWPLDSGGQKHP